MTASEIRGETLKGLRAARKAMLSARWTLALETMDEADKARASKEFMRTHHAIQKLENEQLAALKDKLLENEEELAKGRNKLASALTDIKETRTVLNAISGLLSIVARIVITVAI